MTSIGALLLVVLSLPTLAQAETPTSISRFETLKVAERATVARTAKYREVYAEARRAGQTKEQAGDTAWTARERAWLAWFANDVTQDWLGERTATTQEPAK